MRVPLAWSANSGWPARPAACFRKTAVSVSPCGSVRTARFPAAANQAAGGAFRSEAFADTPWPAAASMTSATVLRLSGVSTENPNSCWSHVDQLGGRQAVEPQILREVMLDGHVASARLLAKMREHEVSRRG